MDFLEIWLLTFVALTILILSVTLMATVFCWLYQSAIGKLILIMVGVSLIITFV